MPFSFEGPIGPLTDKATGRPRLALLSFHDVRSHFAVATDQAEMHFVRWSDV